MLARRQYDAVDPDNRLVAAVPEGRRDERLLSVFRLAGRLAASATRPVAELMPDDRVRFLALGADLGQAWNHADAAPEPRKRIPRVVLPEAVVKLEGGRVEMLLHRQGGDHSSLAVRKNRSGNWRGSCPIVRSIHFSTGPASIGERAIPGPRRGRAPSERAMGSRYIVPGNGSNAAGLPWRRLRRGCRSVK